MNSVYCTRMQNAKKAQRDNGQCLPDYATSPNHAYLKKETLGPSVICSMPTGRPVGTSEASAAKYIKDDYIPRKNDSNYIEELLKQVKEIDLSTEKIDGIIKSHNEKLFLKSGKLKSGRMFHHSFNEHMPSELITLRSQTLHLSDQLKKANKHAKDVFKTQLLNSAVAIKNKRKYDNKWKSKKRQALKEEVSKEKLDQCLKISSRCYVATWLQKNIALKWVHTNNKDKRK